MHKLNPIFRNIVLFSIASISIFFTWFIFNQQKTNLDTSSSTITNKVVKQRSTSSPKASKEAKKARTEYFKKIYKDPRTGEIPRGAGVVDIQIAKSIDANAPIKKNDFSLSWSHAGPSNIGGRTRAIAADKRNTNTLLAGAVAGGIWKSENEGQSWRQVATTNLLPGITSIAQDPRAGFEDTWYAVGGEFDGSSVPFADDSGSQFNTGYLVSNDNGNNWEFRELVVGQSINSAYSWGIFGMSNRVVINPNTGELFIATNGFGVFNITPANSQVYSTLANQSNPTYSDVNVNANGLMLQYLSGNAIGDNDYTPGFKVSWDNGITWTQINVQNQNFSLIERAVIEFSFSDPNTAYALLQDNNGVLDNGVDEVLLYRFTLNSSNQTVAVENVSDFLPDGIGVRSDPQAQTDIKAFNGQGNYNMALTIHPADPNMIFVGLTNIYRMRNINAPTDFSTETALKDVLIGGYGVDTFFYENQHPDQHALYFPDPVNRPNYAVSANDGGLYAVPDISINGPVTWTNLNRGYNATQFYHASISPRVDQDQFVAGSQDNGTPYVLIDHPQLGEQSLGDLSTGDGSFSYTGMDYLYVSSQNGFVSKYFIDQDQNIEGVDYSGFSFTTENYYAGEVANESFPAAFGKSFIHPFTVDRASHDVMYYPADTQGEATKTIYRNPQIRDDNADLLSTWEALPGFSSFEDITALNTSTVPAGRLLLGLSGFNNQGVLATKVVIIDNARSDNPSITEKPILDPNSNQAVDGNIRHIAINPENADEYIVVISNYNVISLFHTTNNGDNFSVIEGNLAGTEAVGTDVLGLSIRTASILPYDGKTLYLVGTSAGLYATTALNGNDTEWVKESPDLIANLPITWIESRPADGMILVATHGQGAFWTKIGVPTSIADNNAVPFEFELFPNYPNPFNPETTIGFSINQASEVMLEVFNSNGQLVSTILNRKLSAGNHSYQFNASNLNSGVYFARLTTNNTVKTQKMTLLK